MRAVSTNASKITVDYNRGFRAPRSPGTQILRVSEITKCQVEIDMPDGRLGRPPCVHVQKCFCRRKIAAIPISCRQAPSDSGIRKHPASEVRRRRRRLYCRAPVRARSAVHGSNASVSPLVVRARVAEAGDSLGRDYEAPTFVEYFQAAGGKRHATGVSL